MEDFNTHQYRLGPDHQEYILKLLGNVSRDIEQQTKAPPKAAAAAALQILISTLQSLIEKIKSEEGGSESPI